MQRRLDWYPWCQGNRKQICRLAPDETGKEEQDSRQTPRVLLEEETGLKGSSQCDRGKARCSVFNTVIGHMLGTVCLTRGHCRLRIRAGATWWAGQAEFTHLWTRKRKSNHLKGAFWCADIPHLVWHRFWNPTVMDIWEICWQQTHIHKVHIIIWMAQNWKNTWLTKKYTRGHT